MNATHKQGHLQQGVIKKFVKNTETQTFFNLLTGPELFDVIESNLPNHRERRFPPTETLAMFLSQALNSDSSCQQVVNDMVLSRASCGLSWQSTNTGSYCKARARLPTELICCLLTHIGSYLSDHSPIDWRWQGRSVKLIDGHYSGIT